MYDSNDLITEGLRDQCNPIEAEDLTVESSNGSTVRQSGPCEEVKAARKRWTKVENLLLWKCYLLSEPNKKGYRKRLFEIWINNGGTSVSEQRLM